MGYYYDDFEEVDVAAVDEKAGTNLPKDIVVAAAAGSENEVCHLPRPRRA